MEVHHHSHTARKKWHHYFWEFLMLFLAVTLGFLVENQREHYIEHLRARQYASSLVDDLKNDTLAFGNLIANYTRNIIKIDTLRSILKQKSISQLPSGALYYYCEPGIWIINITFHDATMQQLKNSGNLRYFSLALQQKISEYDRKARELTGRQDNEIYFSRITREMMTEVFESETIISITDSSVAASLEKFKQSDIRLVKRDTALIKKIVNEIIYRQASWKFRLQQIVEPTRQAAIELLASIKKEYHLD